MAKIPSLTFKNREFLLDGEPIRIFSGALHYFRVVPEYWEDRLFKLKACGLNTVETYVPWNLHEPNPGTFKNDGILDFRRFIKMAADLGLLVIFRPGPYICAEWDYGGLPSWLLADPNMKVRSNYAGYQNAVSRYFAWLLPQITDLQRSSGGPIIAIQVENEFGSFTDDPAHLHFLRDVLVSNGVTELLFTSDNESASRTAPLVDGVLATANGQSVEEVQVVFEVIRKVDKHYPLMVMELWAGWFDQWGKKQHKVVATQILERTLEYCFQHNANVNFYMFHGGTNFGFMSGALDLSVYKADSTSYDYDAPVSEEGWLTEKYFKIKEMIDKESKVKGFQTPGLIPQVPENPKRADSRQVLSIKGLLPWSELVTLIAKKTTSRELEFMEMLTFPKGEVQSYGYIIYRKQIPDNDKKSLTFTGFIRDRAAILLDGKIQAQLERDNDGKERHVVNLADSTDASLGSHMTLDIVVENLGRINYTLKEKQDMLSQQRKGMSGPVKLGVDLLQNWEIFALDFSEDFIQAVDNAATSWRPVSDDDTPPSTSEGCGPGLYKASLYLSEEDGQGPKSDYFVRLNGWHKGVVLVNGFNLGRYWDVGPQRTLYLPAPVLRRGYNEFLVFEEMRAGRQVSLEVEPCLG